MYHEVTIKKGCEKEWRKFLSTLKGKDKECDVDDKGLSMWLMAGFLMTHLPWTFLLFESVAVVFFFFIIGLFSLTQE